MDLGWALEPMTCPYKRKERDLGASDTGRERAEWRGRQRLERSTHKPRNAQDGQQPPEAGREAGSRLSVRASRGSGALPKP